MNDSTNNTDARDFRWNRVGETCEKLGFCDPDHVLRTLFRGRFGDIENGIDGKQYAQQAQGHTNAGNGEQTAALVSDAVF